MSKEWSEMATSLVNTWTETGTKVWQSWFDLMQTVPTTNNLDSTVPELQKATQKFFDNRDLMIRFLKLSVEAWEDIFPKINSGENWQESVKKYTESMREQISSFNSQYLQVNQDSQKLWSLYLEEMQKYSQMWLNPLGMATPMMTKAMLGNSDSLIELNQLYWKLLYEDNLGNLLNSPSLGLNRSLNEKLVAGFESWRQLYQATSEYQVLLGAIQVKSFEALMRKLVELAEKGTPVKEWKAFQTVWSQVSDDVFAEAFCEEKNLKIRGNFLNALNAYRLQQQDIMELSLKSMNLPSRTEIDEIHRSLYDLRKEFKSLKKRLETYEKGTDNSSDSES